MTNLYLNIYNNLIKLTRNKNLYNNKKQDTFYDRMIIFFFHLDKLIVDILLILINKIIYI